MHWFSYKSIYYSINKTQLETHFKCSKVQKKQKILCTQTQCQNLNM